MMVPSIKRAKRGEINHAADHPENCNDDSLEDERLVLIVEFMKNNKNVALIRQKMELTLSEAQGDRELAVYGLRGSGTVAYSVL